MQCYTQLTPPTAVTHCVSLPFLSASANNLVIAKTSLLQVFSIKSIVGDANDRGTEPASTEHDLQLNASILKLQRKERQQTSKLVLLTQYEVSGTITALARIKIIRSRSGGEALLVALKDAKMSLVEWDPERFTISTISLHYYEKEDIQRAPWTPPFSECVDYLSVDPGSRCAALKFGARNIAILPFRQAGDDLVMDDYSSTVTSPQLEHRGSITNLANGESNTAATLYSPSFVLSLLALDPALTHPLHLTFLHGYREPTFGVLSSQIAVSSALLHERKDPISYTVYTLDLEQRASTTLLSITRLPYDLRTIVPLPAPIGGALLVGINEFIHVDQAGKINSVAVNESARQSSSFQMPSQADLNIRLEGCVIEPLGTSYGELLIILRSGDLAVLTFKVDGRSVSGLAVYRVALQSGGLIMNATASCASTIGRGRIFVGSESGDSVLLGWSTKSVGQKRQRLNVKVPSDGDSHTSDFDDDFEDEDDLYSGEKLEGSIQPATESPASTNDVNKYVFRIHESLLNLAPLCNLAALKPTQPTANHQLVGLDPCTNFALAVTIGRGNSSRLVKICPEISPSLAKTYPLGDTQGVWSVSLNKAAAAKVNGPSATNGWDSYDNFVVTSILDDTGEEMTRAYTLDQGILKELDGDEFDPSAGATIEVGTLNGGTLIAQVLRSEIKLYDSDFGLAQIFPVSDDPEDPKIVSASFAEPYMLLVRDDSSLMILKADESGELDEIACRESLQSTKWLSGSLFDDSDDTFRLELNEDDEESSSVLMFLLSVTGGLKIFRMSRLDQPAYTAEGLSFLPPFLSPDFTVRRSNARDVLTEILVAEIGDGAHKAPYLILRSASDDLIIYQPYQCLTGESSDAALRFLKVSNTHVPRAPSEHTARDSLDSRLQPLRVLGNVNGYSAVFLPGHSPSFILKTASSHPHVICLHSGAIGDLSGFHTQNCERGFIAIGEKGNVFSAQLPFQSDFTTGWVVQRLLSGECIRAFDYHEASNRYILGVGEEIDFKLPDDELHPEWSTEATAFLPRTRQDTLKVLDSSTNKVTDHFPLDPYEEVLCIKVMSLEISEYTHERRSLIVVGTAILRGDDLTAQGRIYVFDIIEVVPEPGHPETGYKLKQLAKEEVKGAVTALSEVGTEGFLLAAQGQKVLARGLKEDGTLLPVAFMDAQCYLTVVKELKGTGLCIFGDAVQGVQFAGYMEDPYQIKTFGRSSQTIEVIAADFLPDSKQLYIVVVDADCILHLLQFEPQNPRSHSGLLLLPLSTFHLGSYPSTSTLLPRTPTSHERLALLTTNPSPSTSSPHPNRNPFSSSSSDPPFAQHHILLTTQTGSLALLTPLSASAYRSLLALQSYLTNTLPHPLGLNPRAYRKVEAEVAVGGRGVVDGDLVRRWMELGSWKRAEGVARCGADGEWELRRLVEGVGGRGLGGGVVDERRDGRGL